MELIEWTQAHVRKSAWVPWSTTSKLRSSWKAAAPSRAIWRCRSRAAPTSSRSWRRISATSKKSTAPSRSSDPSPSYRSTFSRNCASSTEGNPDRRKMTKKGKIQNSKEKKFKKKIKFKKKYLKKSKIKKI